MPQHAVIASPITVRPSMTIGEVHRLIAETGIMGFPVVDDAAVLVGIVYRAVTFAMSPHRRCGCAM
ncbi:MAG: CBS domain-containing protein [Polyangia bacterium]